MTNHYETDYLDELFGSGAVESEPESVRLAREIAEMRAEKAAREQEKAKNRCPRCMGHVESLASPTTRVANASNVVDRAFSTTVDSCNSACGNKNSQA